MFHAVMPLKPYNFLTGNFWSIWLSKSFLKNSFLFLSIDALYLGKGSSYPPLNLSNAPFGKKKMTDAHQIILKWFLLSGMLVDTVHIASTDLLSFKTVTFWVTSVAFSVCGNENNDLLWPITFFPENKIIIFWAMFWWVDSKHCQSLLL